MPRPSALCPHASASVSSAAVIGSAGRPSRPNSPSYPNGATIPAAINMRWQHWGLEALAFALLTVASSVAWPQATMQHPEGFTVHYREGQRIDPLQVRQILSADAPARGRTRSIRLLDGDAAGALAPPQEPVAPHTLSAPIQFGFDSTVILPEARDQLDAIAEGIKLLAPGRAVVIEGHTDAAGSDDYNQQLSRRRAAAVKQYLAQRHGIAPQRLRDVGLGEREPIEGLDPLAPENRRVQFRGG